MSLFALIIGIIASAVISVIVDWLIKPLLPQNPTVKHGFIGIIFVVVLAIVVVLLSDTSIGKPGNPVLTKIPDKAVSSTPDLPVKSPSSTPKPTNTIAPTKTPIPIFYDVNSSDYSVQLSESTSSTATINFFFDESPIYDEYMYVIALQKNIAGDLFCDYQVFSEQYPTDINGSFETDALPPGLYAVFFNERHADRGLFGISLPEERNCPSGMLGIAEGFVFPVQQSKQTVVNIKLVNIEVGVIYNGEAQSRSRVMVSRTAQTTSYVWTRTDNSGKAVLMVGAGDYNICVAPLSSFDDDVCVPLSVPDGVTYIQKIIDMPYKPGP